MPYLAVSCRAALITVFLLAVAGKAAGRRPFRQFTRSITAMRVISPRAATIAAGITVSAEAVVITLAAAPVRAAGVTGCALGAALSVLFTCAIAISLRRGNRAPCRCFGRSATPLGARHIARNLIVLAVSATGAVASANGTAHVAGGIVAAGTGLFLGLVIAACDDIIELVTDGRSLA